MKQLLEYSFRKSYIQFFPCSCSLIAFYATSSQRLLTQIKIISQIVTLRSIVSAFTGVFLIYGSYELLLGDNFISYVRTLEYFSLDAGASFIHIAI